MSICAIQETWFVMLVLSIVHKMLVSMSKKADYHNRIGINHKFIRFQHNLLFHFVCFSQEKYPSLQLLAVYCLCRLGENH